MHLGRRLIGGRVACAHVQPVTIKAHALSALPGFPASGFGRRPERNIGVVRG